MDEFDYQYVIALENYTSKRKIHPQIRPRQGPANFGSKCFYELTRIEPGKEEGKLVARDVQELFMTDVRKAAADIIIDAKMAGPAVKIIISDPSLAYDIKIDLTLGIEANVLDLFDEDELTPVGVRLLHESKLKCHFVSSMEYWKVCFVEAEQELMHEIIRGNMSPDKDDPFDKMYGTNSPSVKETCYTIVKCLRDEFGVKDQYGDYILQSYPLKVTFLDIALKDEEKKLQWTTKNIGKTVVRILKEVEIRGQDHRICNLFVKDDDVISESDRSHMESTRILDELERMHDTFLMEKSIFPHVFMIIIALISYVVHMVTFGMNVNFFQSSTISALTVNTCPNLQKYANRSYVWADISSGKYDMIIFLFFLQDLLYIVSVSNSIIECSRIKGLPRGDKLWLLIPSFMLIWPLGNFLRLALSDCNRFDSYDQKVRYAVYLCQLSTVYPLIHASLRISQRTFLFSSLKKDVIVILDSVFDMSVSRHIPVYVAETSFRRRHRLALFALDMQTIFLLSIISFSYFYIWIEEDDLKFGEPHPSFSYILPMLSILTCFYEFFMPTIWAFIVGIVAKMITTRYFYPYIAFSEASLLLLVFSFAFALCMLNKLSLGIINTISKCPLLFEISTLSRSPSEIIHKIRVYACIAFVFVFAAYFNEMLIRSAWVLKTIHKDCYTYFNINPEVLFPFTIYSVLLLSLTQLSLALWSSSQSKAFRKFTIRMITAKYRSALSSIKNNIFLMILVILCAWLFHQQVKSIKTVEKM